MATITTEATIREIVRELPTMVDSFKKLGIDPQDDAGATLHQACQSKGLCPQIVVDLLLQADTHKSITLQDVSHLTITQLADHIVANHHQYLRRELPRLQVLLDCDAPSGLAHDLEQIRSIFALLRAELEQHMVMEEQVLFPLIQEIAWASQSPGCYGCSGNRSIAQAEHNHHGFKCAMSDLHTLTDQFTPPEAATTAYRGFLNGLAELRQDLDQHTHLEVDVLLPRVTTAEAKLRNNSVSGQCEICHTAEPMAYQVK